MSPGPLKTQIAASRPPRRAPRRAQAASARRASCPPVSFPPAGPGGRAPRRLGPCRVSNVFGEFLAPRARRPADARDSGTRHCHHLSQWPPHPRQHPTPSPASRTRQDISGAVHQMAAKAPRCGGPAHPAGGAPRPPADQEAGSGTCGHTLRHPLGPTSDGATQSGKAPAGCPGTDPPAPSPRADHRVPTAPRKLPAQLPAEIPPGLSNQEPVAPRSLGFASPGAESRSRTFPSRNSRSQRMRQNSYERHCSPRRPRRSKSPGLGAGEQPSRQGSPGASLLSPQSLILRRPRLAAG